MANYVVLGVRQFSFKDDRDRQVEGCKVTYLDAPSDQPGVRGYQPLTVTTPIEYWNQFTTIPAIYNIDFAQRPDAKGKPVLTVRNAEFIDQVDFSELSVRS
jgi:hypothetical protein